MKVAAPWRARFLEQVAEMKPPIFVLSTLHPVSPSASSSTTTGPACVPRARTVVFRGMWASLPDNPLNPAPRNRAAYESDLLAFTTDARMDKADEITSSASSDSNAREASGHSPPPSSGGGGPVEAVFWMPSAKTQWRLRGRAYVLGPDIDSTSSEDVRRAKEALLARMRVVSSETGSAAAPASRSVASDPASESEISDWSWSAEITAHFGNLSPGMRGSFRNPPPGTPRDHVPDDGRLRLGQKVEDLHDEVARRNFRVVVVVPTEVDEVDLRLADDGRRRSYRYLREGEPAMNVGKKEGEWEVTELWP